MKSLDWRRSQMKWVKQGERTKEVLEFNDSITYTPYHDGLKFTIYKL